MAPHAGLLWTSVALLVAGVLFFVTSVAGILWPKASPPDDLGVYSVTVVLVAFGLGGLVLRWAKTAPEPPL